MYKLLSFLLVTSCFAQTSLDYKRVSNGPGISVFTYGAIGDGVHDDTVAIQAGVTAIIASGGGILFFPPTPNGYSICAVTIRATSPVIIFGYGAVIKPSCENQYVFTSYGLRSKFFGLSFLGTGGKLYEGIHITSDSTTTASTYQQIQDIYMVNMYRGALLDSDAVTCPSCSTYRTIISDSIIENFYLQKTWSGSFGLSFSGTVNGNGANDSKVQGSGIKGYENNVIIRGSSAVKLQQTHLDGGLNALLYDGGNDTEFDHLYIEYNTNVVTTSSATFGVLPYQLTVLGGTQANYSTCVNGNFFNSLPPTVLTASDGCFSQNTILTQQVTPGTTQMPATNGLDLGPWNLGAGATDKISFKLSGGNWLMDFSNLNAAKNFTFSRPGLPFFFTTSLVNISGAVQVGRITVGALATCNSASDGQHSAVSDSNAASYTSGIGAIVAGGGTTHVPVYCDGTNWRIG